MDKVIRDGKVAVIITDHYGFGWYSEYRDFEALLFHPKLVEIVENGNHALITQNWVKENLGLDVEVIGAKNLSIHWLPIGTSFTVEEYDGQEKIITSDDLKLLA